MKMGNDVDLEREHPSDDELLRAAGGELTPRAQQPVAAHLRQCHRCRIRCAQLSDALEALAPGRAQTAADAGRHARSRARLQAALHAAPHEPVRWWQLPARAVAGTNWRWAGAAAALAAAALIVDAVAPGSARGPRVGMPLLAADARPHPSLTPGATSGIGVDELCAATPPPPPPIPEQIRQRVIRDYGIERVPDDQYELDYLITPELGGATDPRNLWPQPYGAPQWNALVKDELERLLPALVCSGQVALRTAQHDIASDWIGAYQRYVTTYGRQGRADHRGGSDRWSGAWPSGAPGRIPALALDARLRTAAYVFAPARTETHLAALSARR
jgi:hypothetical protein